MPRPPVQRITLNSQKDFLLLMAKNSGKVSTSDDTAKQLETLRKQRTRLGKIEDFVNDPRNRDKIRRTRLTLRQLLSQINDNLKIVRGKISALKALQLKQQNFANRVVIPANDGEYAGNGKCYIQFVNVGMGDCSLITTPSGKTIMIDLGSDAQSDVSLGGQIPGTNAEIIRSNITSKFFLNGGSTIDLLLLTHPDADHFNQLETILQGYVSAINMVYYGGADKFSKYYPENGFVEGLASRSAIKSVVLKELSTLGFNGAPVTSCLLGGASIGNQGQANTIGREYRDPNTGEIVLYYEQSGNEVVFKLSILAANATGVWIKNNTKFATNDTEIKRAGEMKLNGTPNNVRSLVVMAECYGRKVIVTGDATAIPEQYVAKTYPNILAAADTLRFGHHGSPTSSARVFINAFTNIKRAVASTGGPNTVLHNLPKKQIIEEYIAKVPQTAAAHTIYAFGDESMSIQPIPNITNNLFATGSNGTVQFIEARTTSQVRTDNKLIYEQTHHNS